MDTWASASDSLSQVLLDFTLAGIETAITSLVITSVIILAAGSLSK